MKKANQKTKQVKHRKVTIDELALMIGKGFKGVDERFNKMDERMNRMEMKLDSLERRIFVIEDILNEHRNILNEHGKDIKEIKAELKALKKIDNGNAEKIFALEQRAKVLEVKIG